MKGRRYGRRSQVMSSPRRLILDNHQAPGDTLMLTAAVRDLHRCHPGKFITDVRRPSADLWRHNPHITPLHEDGPGVERLVCPLPAGCDSAVMFLKGERNTVRLACVGQRSS